MADTFYVLQIKAAGATTPTDEFAAFQVAEDVRKLIQRVTGRADSDVTIIDAFTDTAETVISEA